MRISDRFCKLLTLSACVFFTVLATVAKAQPYDFPESPAHDTHAVRPFVTMFFIAIIALVVVGSIVGIITVKKKRKNKEQK